MLRLKNTRNGSEVLMVLKPGGYTVGRKDCSIKIEGDQSISRKHALLTVSHPIENVGHPERLPLLELEDSSKYGTIVNEKKIAPGSTASLRPGDNVTFGALNSNSWRVEYTPLVAACSGLPGKDKLALKKILSELGGHLVSEWNDSCTLLVMKQVNVTAKVIGALVTCRHIVTPAYLREYRDAVLAEGKPILPDPSRFLPPVMERAINQDSAPFAVMEERKTMLQGKTFVFLSEKQHRRLHTVINLAGGKTVLYTSGECSHDVLRDPQTCVLQSEAADNTQTPGDLSQEVGGILRRNKLRMVAEAELGLAVLTVSTAVYCNPSVPKEGLKLINCMKESQTINPATQKVLAADTQQSEIPSSLPLGGKKPSPKTKSKDQDTTDPFKSPTLPTEPPPTTTSKKQDEQQQALPSSSGVSLFSKSDASENDFSEDPFAEPPRDSKTMKRPLSSEDEVPPPRISDDPGTGRKKKIKRELVEEDLPGLSDIPVVGGGDLGRGRTIKTEPVDVEDVRAVADEPITAEDPDLAAGPTTVKTENIPISVDENANLSEIEDSEISQSQWRQNKRRRRRISENEDDQKDATIVSEPIKEDPAEDLPSLPGFFSKNNRPRLVVKEEVTSYESGLPKALVVVKSVSLVCQQPASNASRRVNGITRNVKNFKNFRKSSYAGQCALPQIIGGSDLEVHRNMASQASQDVFLSDPQRNSDIDRAEALADELFSVEPKVRRVR